MHGEANRLRLIGERAFDRLLDPPRGVGGKFSTLRRIEALDGFHQADVALRNQIEQRQSKIRIIVRDLNDQTQIRTNHQGASFLVAALNFSGEFNLLLWSEQWDLPDFPQVNLYSSIAIFGCHKTSQIGRASCRERVNVVVRSVSLEGWVCGRRQLSKPVRQY